MHLVEKIFAIILMGDENKLLEILRQILLISLSWAFVIVSQILGADLSDSGVASRYNLVVVSTTLDYSF